MAKLPASSVDLDVFTNRFAKETDRACGVLGAAFLDALLEEHFRRQLAHLKDELLSHRGCLGSFGSRIDTAYALSWISSDMHADLNVIRKIRNSFAHEFDHELDFSDQSIADQCHNLRTAQAFLDGFSKCKENNPHLSSTAIDSMRNVFTSSRMRFQITVELMSQVLSDLPDQRYGEYAGPDLLQESFETSAAIRITLQGTGTVGTPPRDQS